MSIPTFTVNLTSTLDADDRRAILDILTAENLRIVAANAVLASTNPPGTPIALLDVSTGASRKNAYEGYIGNALLPVHASWVAAATAKALLDPSFQALRSPWQDATPAKRTAASAAFLAAIV